jgi:protein-disulfide isomerase
MGFLYKAKPGRYNRRALPAPFFKALLALTAALALSGAACDRNTKPVAQPIPPAGPSPTVPTAGADGPLHAPGMDFSSLSAPAQRELRTVFSDEFCYCGCPHTLGACLKEHPDCRHARRMAGLAAQLAEQGAPATEIIVLLSRYYLSFRERAELPVDSRMCVGPADAKVTVVEFSDFECPFCAAAAPVLEAFAKKHPEVRLCHLPFPLQSHPNALPAAQAALFAREHGRFWEMHHALFEHSGALSRQTILELGEKIGLPRAGLARALDEGAYQDEIRASRELGRRAGVDSTPSIFVNGRKLLLGLGPGTLKHTVEDELEWQAHRGWAKD